MNKIGIFAYNFPHWKTQATIQNLTLSGKKPDVIFAADKVKLNHYQSKIRVSPKELFLWHPSEIAKHFDIPYYVLKHNSDEISSLVESYQLDVGVIAGARILKPSAFNNFKIGVVNMHPGLLPENRGLDTIKWAIINDIPQGVTVHIIDERIDRGLLVEKERIEIFNDDTLVDIFVRIQNLEQRLLLQSLEKLESPSKFAFEEIGEGIYNSAVPEDIESSLMEMFETYLSKHSG